MRRMMPLSVSVARASYTACSETAPRSDRTTAATSAAVLCDPSLTARRTARRWAVTCTPCRRSCAAVSRDASTDATARYRILERVQYPRRRRAVTDLGLSFGASPGLGRVSRRRLRMPLVGAHVGRRAEQPCGPVQVGRRLVLL